MKQKRLNKSRIGEFLYGLMGIWAAFLCVLGGVDYVVPDGISIRASGESVIEASAMMEHVSGLIHTETRDFKFGGILPVKQVSVTTVSDKRLYPGGMLFGVRCATAGVLVIGLEDVCDKQCPAKAAGIHVGDIVTAVDGHTVTSVKSLADFVSADGKDGKEVVLSIKRGEELLELAVTPIQAADGMFRAGIWSRDSTAGIGTVTFIDPETGLFGGLGHGICDVDTGALLPLARGTTLGVNITEIMRGSAGVPGELRGCFSGDRTGSLTRNTACGVFGVFAKVPAAPVDGPLPIGLASEVHEGAATIYCTLDETGPKEYTVEILHRKSETGKGGVSKNFVIAVTDPVLLEKTGGIIQGMSGSPIIQDGKLIGAVTHVLVNHPERGYGIYLENMLRAMEEETASEHAA